MEWTYLTTAPDQTLAEIWAGLLRDAGIRAALNPEDVYSYLGVSPRPCRLLVPASELDRAREALRAHGLMPGE